jgi:hypothetical protein
MSSNVHYINHHEEQPHAASSRSIADVLHEAKAELKQFLETRFAMLQSEMGDKLSSIKSAAPMIAVGALMGATAFLVLTGALITVLAKAFASTGWGLFLAFAVVGVVYGIFGFAMLFYGYRALLEKGFVPDRTLKVIKDDMAWLETETRMHS